MYTSSLDDGDPYADAAPPPAKKRRTTARYRDRLRHPDDVLRRDLPAYLAEGCPADPMGTQEAVFAQYWALSVFPESKFAFSAFHAGPGQYAFGAAPQCKADVMVASDDGRGRRRLSFANYHGIRYHFDGLHSAGCPARPAFEHCHDGPDGRPGELSRTTAFDDELKRGLAEALSAVDPDSLVVTYDAVTECDLFHRGGDFARPSTWNAEADDSACDGHSSLRDFMGSRHGDDFLSGSRDTAMTQAELMDRIMSRDDNRRGPGMGGFVVIDGGAESDTGTHVDSQGFCFQRSRLDPETDVGPFTRFSARSLAALRGGVDPSDAEAVDRAIDEMLAEMLSEPVTMARRSFGRSTETLGLDFFRMLVREKGLTDVVITHYLFYEERHYLRPFFTALLQMRHDVKRGGVPNAAVLALVIKQILNSIYGFACVESPKYTVTDIVCEGTLEKMRREELLDRINPARHVQTTLLGYRTDDDPARTPELIYAVTRRNENARIFNHLQMACSILSQSKLLLFEALLLILRYFDPAKLVLCYCDTDSMLLSASEDSLRECFDERNADGLAYEQVAPRILADLESDREQAGLFKIEGVYRQGYFRNAKAYYLDGRVDTEEQGAVVRMRSIPRHRHSNLGPRHFGQDPALNSGVVSYTGMRPTAGLEIVKADETRALCHSLNFKRFHIVSARAQARKRRVPCR